MKISRLWLPALAVVVVGAALLQAFKPRATPVETAEVLRGRFEATIEEDGKTRVRNRFTLTAPIAGHLDRIELRSGDTVAAGQVVATIRPLPPALRDARTLAELRERLGAAEAAAARASANVGRARAAVAQAEADLSRSRELAERGFTSKSAVDNARFLVTQQSEALKAARFEEDAARHELALARASVDYVAGSQERVPADRAATGPSQTIAIPSPVAGRILETLRISEGAVNPGAALLEIGDLAAMEAVIDVRSEEATRIREGNPVRLLAAADARPVAGRVTRVEPVARTRVSTLGVEEQRVAVIADFERTDGDPRIGDGYRVRATIVTDQQEGALLVPIGAIFRSRSGAAGSPSGGTDQTGWQVFIVDGDRARLKNVTVTGRNDRWASVSGGPVADGVQAGVRVIVYPSELVVDGGRVARLDAAS